MNRLLATIVLLATSGTGALGAEIIDSRFQVEVTSDSQTTTSADLQVPYLPGAACYNWLVRFDPATVTGEVTLFETLSLPEPLAAWKDYVNDPAAPTQIDADAQRAVTTLVATPDEDGWVSHGWCVAEGDPLGDHNITVTFEDNEVGNWDFAVVPADVYAPLEPAPIVPAAPQATPPPLPAPQPSPTARDANRTC